MTAAPKSEEEEEQGWGERAACRRSTSDITAISGLNRVT